MITPAQCRAARALLGWSQDDLARQSSSSKKTIADFERGATTPRARTTDKLESTLMGAGIEFLDDGRPGVRHREQQPEPPTKIVSSDDATRRRQEIETAFRKLPLKADVEEILNAAIDLVELIANGKAAPDTQFRRVGRTKSAAELKALSKAATALVKAIDVLHAPAIEALAALPPPIVDRTQLRQGAAAAAQAAEHADVSSVPLKPPRQRENRAAPRVASYLAHKYRQLTGNMPKIATREGVIYGLFFDLVRDVFQAMGLRDSAEVAAREALSNLPPSRCASL